MGNCTVAIKRRNVGPVGKTIIADITLSSSYADGGDTLLLSDLGLKTVDAVVLCGNAAPGGAGADVTGRALVVVHGATPSTDPKIAVYQQGAGAGPLTERGAGSNESGVTFRAVIFGDLYQSV